LIQFHSKNLGVSIEKNQRSLYPPLFPTWKFVRVRQAAGTDRLALALAVETMLFNKTVLLGLLKNSILIFWHSFIVLSLYDHANRQRKVVTDNTGAFPEIKWSDDKTLLLECQLQTGKLPDVIPQRAYSTGGDSLVYQHSHTTGDSG
jgi:hypothetical protein